MTVCVLWWRFNLQWLVNPKFKPTISSSLGVLQVESTKLFHFFNYISRAPNPSQLFGSGLHHSAAELG
jgi:hypothetical protein